MIASARLPDGRLTSAKARRLVLGLRRGDAREADHINWDGLVNRRSNLRAVGRSGNQCNSRAGTSATSAHSGVCWATDRPKWRAQIQVSGRKVNLGYFGSELEAAAAAAYLRAKADRDSRVLPSP